MATIDLSVRDNISAGAQAAAESLNKLADAADKASDSATKVGETTSAALPGFTTLNRKLDESAGLAAKVEAANRKYEAALASLRAEAQKNADVAANLDQLERNAAADRDISIQKATQYSARLKEQRDAVESLDGSTKSSIVTTKQQTDASGQAAYAARQLSVQTIQAVSGLATGQNLMTVLIQQGHQVLDSMLATGAGLAGMGRAIGTMLAPLFTPLGLLVAGIVGVGISIAAVISRAGSLADESRTLQTAIDGVGRSYYVTGNELSVYADQLARTSSLSRQAATDVIANAARTPGITVPQIATIAALAPNLGAATGIDPASAAKLLTDAYTGQTSAIDKLVTSTNVFSKAQIEAINDDELHGRSLDAMRIITDQLKISLKDAEKNSLSPMQQEVRSLSNTWGEAFDNIAKSSIGKIISGQMKDTIEETRLLGSLIANVFKTTGPEPIKPVVPSAADAVTGAGGAPTGPQPPTNLQIEQFNKLNKVLKDQNEVLAASLPTRAAVTAAQKAEVDAKAAAITEDQAALLKQNEINTAMRQAADAYVQAAAAGDRLVKATNAVADATDQGAAIAARLLATTQAQEKAATQAGVSVALETERILQLAAANEQLKVAQENATLKRTAQQQTDLSEAPDLATYHQIELNNAVKEVTNSLLVQAAASNDPKVIEATMLRVQGYKDSAFYLEQETEAAKANQQLLLGKQQVDYLKAQVDTLGQGETIRTRNLAMLREQQTIEATLPEIGEKQRKSLVEQAGAIADQNTALQTQTNAYAEIGNFASTAFTQIGQAISDSFLSGTGAAVNWANVTRALVAQVIQEFLKLAVLSPIIQGLTGNTTTATLGSVASALGGTGVSSSSASGGSSSISTLLSAGSTLSSASGALGGPTIMSSLGITGEGGLMSSMGLSGAGSSVSGLLSTPLATGMGINAGAGSFGAVTLGQAISGVGVGFAAGSLAGGLIQGALNKEGPAPTIGAGVGAVTGAAIGSIIPGIGTVLGGLIGGLIGGGGGAFIGPHVKNPYTSTFVGLDDGQLVAGASSNQITASNRDSTVKDIDTINKTLAAGNLRISSVGNFNQVGTGGGLSPVDPAGAGGKYSDLIAAFPQLRFTSSSDTSAAQLLTAHGGFATLTELQTWITGFQAAQTATKNIIDGSTNLAGTFGKTTGSVTDNLAAVNKQFDDANKTIADLKASSYVTTQQITDLTTAEANLTSVRADAIAKINEAVAAQLNAIDTGLTTRTLQAKATLSGSPTDAETAGLYAFDQNAPVQRAALKEELVGMFGDSYTTTAEYATRMALLESTLGQERLALVKQYNDQITAAQKQADAADVAAHAKALTDAGATVTNISSYLSKLQLGGSSPLSGTDQLALARGQFDKDTTQIGAGNLSNISNLTSDADALLSASRAVNGSGAGYVVDFNKVLGGLSNIASMSADTLTADIFTAETKAQTQVLSDGLAALGEQLAALRLEMRQGASTPAQIAA